MPVRQLYGPAVLLAAQRSLPGTAPGAAGQLLSAPAGSTSRCLEEEQGCAAGKSLRQSRLKSMI